MGVERLRIALHPTDVLHDAGVGLGSIITSAPVLEAIYSLLSLE
jgi:hypothetical protein